MKKEELEMLKRELIDKIHVATAYRNAFEVAAMISDFVRKMSPTKKGKRILELEGLIADRLNSDFLLNQKVRQCEIDIEELRNESLRFKKMFEAELGQHALTKKEVITLKEEINSYQDQLRKASAKLVPFEYFNLKDMNEKINSLEYDKSILLQEKSGLVFEVGKLKEKINELELKSACVKSKERSTEDILRTENSNLKSKVDELKKAYDELYTTFNLIHDAVYDQIQRRGEK